MHKRYIVLDPGFEHQDSHHPVVNGQLYNACSDKEKFVIVTSKQLCFESPWKGAEVIPYFDVNLYPDGYQDLPPSLYSETVEGFVNNLNILFDELKVGEGDCLIIHTALSYLYEALGKSLYCGVAEGLTVYLSTMFSPGYIIEFGEESTLSLREYLRHKFSFAIFNELEKSRGVKFIVQSPTQLYLDAYQRLWPEKNMQLHPSVCGGGKVESTSTGVKILAYLGGPKWDKGIEFTVSAIIELSKLYPQHDYIFHFNNEFPGAELYFPLVAKLESTKAANIQIIKGNLKKETYEKLLSSVSTYLMLYDPESYRYKTSGVLWDVLRHAQNKKIIVSKDTWHERELIQIGACFSSVDYGDIESLIELIGKGEDRKITPRVYRSQYVRSLLDDFGRYVFDCLKGSEKSAPKLFPKNNKRALIVRTDYGHFTSLSGPGGFIEFLPDNGYEVEEALVPLGHQNIDFEENRSRWDLLSSAKSYLQSYQVNSFDVECQVLKKFDRYDVVHFVDAEHSGLYVALARLQGILPKHLKLVATFHQPEDVLKKLIVNPEYLKGFDSIQIMSPCQKDCLLGLGAASEQLKVVPHGVASAHFLPGLPADFPENANTEIFSLHRRFDGKKLIISVGNWLRDYETFIDVAKNFCDREDVIFVVVSKGLSLNEGCPSNVILLNGGLSDRALHWMYRRCEIMFLPLLGGAANNAVLEAVAANTQVVTSDLPSTRYYTNGKAIYCKSRESFIREIDNLLTTYDMGKGDYGANFGWAGVTKDLVNVVYK